MSATNVGHDKKEATLLRQSSYLIEWKKMAEPTNKRFQFHYLTRFVSLIFPFSPLLRHRSTITDWRAFDRIRSSGHDFFFFSFSCRRSCDGCLFSILLYCLLIWLAPGLAHTHTYERKMQFRHSFWTCDVLLLHLHRWLWPVKWKYKGEKIVTNSQRLCWVLRDSDS